MDHRSLERSMQIARCFQRCKVARQGKPITGFDSAFDIDYMGSAEFEFGALPKSLRRVTANLPKYFIAQSDMVDHAGVHVFVVCDSDEKTKLALAMLPELRDRKRYLQEASYFDYAISGGTDSWRKIDLWWDIDNDWFFTIGKPTADLLMVALEALRRKWTAEAQKP